MKSSRATARRRDAGGRGRAGRNGSRRSAIVWASLAGCMALGALLLSGPSRASAVATDGAVRPLAAQFSSVSLDSVVAPDGAPLRAWDTIVIHHSGGQADTPGSIAETHTRQGLDSIGYHFVIGNGRRMDDGVLHVTERWLEQRRGDHVIGEGGAALNPTSIGICLAGDGDRSPFTERQLGVLVHLLRSLQERYGIASE
ncbi:MAG: peptidoglycan recognition family protein, partial [Planctomycetota bacterium]